MPTICVYIYMDIHIYTYPNYTTDLGFISLQPVATEAQANGRDRGGDPQCGQIGAGRSLQPCQLRGGSWGSCQVPRQRFPSSRTTASITTNIVRLYSE